MGAETTRALGLSLPGMTDTEPEATNVTFAHAEAARATASAHKADVAGAIRPQKSVPIGTAVETSKAGPVRPSCTRRVSLARQTLLDA